MLGALELVEPVESVDFVIESSLIQTASPGGAVVRGAP
jgi:hypothetical protein